MSDIRLYRRLARRLTHRSRSLASSIALLLLALAAVAVAVEAILALLGRPAVVASPDRLLAWLDSGTVWGYVAGGVAVVLGIVPLLLAVLPGRRPRRVIPAAELLIVIDDDVLASSLSRAAADGAGVPRDQVRTVLARRRARVRIQPSSGFPIDPAVPLPRLGGVLDAARTRPAIAPRVIVSTEGRLR